jgi:hypothetical protein
MTEVVLGLHEGSDAREIAKEWLQRNPIPFEVIEDPKNPIAPITLVERLSGKSLRFPWAAIQTVFVDKSPDTGTPYLRLQLDDGRVFALAGIGIIFAPSFIGTGPVPDCPASACFQDYQKLRRHLEHLAADDHEEQKREAIAVLMVLLAFLEGARLVGLDVAEEERDLEAILARLEANKR